MAARYRNSVANCRGCVPVYATPHQLVAINLFDSNYLSACAEVELDRGEAAQRRAIRQGIDDTPERIANYLTLELQF